MGSKYLNHLFEKEYISIYMLLYCETQVFNQRKTGVLNFWQLYGKVAFGMLMRNSSINAGLECERSLRNTCLSSSSSVGCEWWRPCSFLPCWWSVLLLVPSRIHGCNIWGSCPCNRLYNFYVGLLRFFLEDLDWSVWFISKRCRCSDKCA